MPAVDYLRGNSEGVELNICDQACAGATGTGWTPGHAAGDSAGDIRLRRGAGPVPRQFLQHAQ